jgi:DNA-binding CsgD family transcriptional regulator
LVHPLRLKCLSPDETFAYVRERGLDDDALAKTILEATGGHPMALSMSTSLALRHQNEEFVASPEWRALLRGLLDYFLADLEPALAAVVLESGARLATANRHSTRGQRGRATLTWNRQAIDQLCRLSIVSAADDGFVFDDEFDRLLSTYGALPAAGESSQIAISDVRATPTSPAAAVRGGQLARDAAASVNAPSVVRKVRALRPTPERVLGALTPREHEVAERIGRGQTTNREIAKALVISPGTANLHVKRILAKLGLTTRAQLAGLLSQRASTVEGRPDVPPEQRPDTDLHAVRAG